MATGTYSITQNQVVTITATPAAGWRFRTWSWPGNDPNYAGRPENPTSLNMTENVSIIAVFDPIVVPIPTQTIYVSAYCTANNRFCGARSISYTCPSGSTPVLVPYTNPLDSGYQTCFPSLSGSTFNLEARIFQTRINTYWGFTEYSVVSACSEFVSGNNQWGCRVGRGQPCQIRLQCGTETAVGTLSPKECTVGSFVMADPACDPTADDSYCRTKCGEGGWQNGRTGSCSANYWCNPEAPASYPCGIMVFPIIQCRADSSSHTLACYCWND